MEYRIKSQPMGWKNVPSGLPDPRLACQKPMQLGRPKDALRIHEDHPSGLTAEQQRIHKTKKKKNWENHGLEITVQIYIYTYIDG